MQTLLDLYRFRFILQNLVSKNLKVQYRNMALGFLWSVVNPLVLVTVLTTVWVVIWDNPFSVAASILVTLVPYNLFVVCLSGCTGAIRENVNLVKKVAFPRQILPVSVVLTHVIQFPLPFALVVLGLLVIPKNHPTLTGNLVWLGPIFVLQIGLSFGVGFLVSALHTKYRDMQYIVESFLVVLFWTSPILYDASLELGTKIAAGELPEWVWWAYHANPVSGLLDSYRNILFYGRPPDWTVLAMTLVGTLIIGAVGVRAFWVHEKEFADLI